MTKDDTVYLKEILDSIAQVQEYLQGVTYETFLQERMRQDAVIMQIEIIGESARKLSQDFRKKHFQVPWLQIINMRHRVAHEYSSMDKRVVWDTATTDLEPLKEAVLRILSEL
ncbi:MAG: DUF86 domain-containing protein [Chloroflexi bacterium]|nr:DUF86 domain-containing protein [Chloroflexota bacterium]